MRKGFGLPITIALLLSILLLPVTSLASQSSSSVSEFLRQLQEQLASSQAEGEVDSLPDPDEPPSPYIGVVKIGRASNKSYTEAREGPSANADILYRVHYGERYLCTDKIGSDWYEIELYTGETAYVLSTFVSIVSRDTDELTLSDNNFPWAGGFSFKLNAKADAYSQPKSGAQAKRYRSDGSVTTFYFNKGMTLTCAAKTTNGRDTWYMLLADNDGISELFWVKASTGKVTEGDPDYAIIPISWYD